MQMEQLQIYSGFNYEMKRKKDEIASWFRFVELSDVICVHEKGKKYERKQKSLSFSYIKGICLGVMVTRTNF